MRSLVVFILIVAAAAAFGGLFPPDEWFDSLVRPPLAPPNWVFAPVWSVLYLCIAVSAWRVWRSGRKGTVALPLWSAQLVLNALWSLIFFGLQRPDLALVEILILLAILLATTAVFLRADRLAGALMIPYAIWVAFASYLNAGFWWLNA